MPQGIFFSFEVRRRLIAGLSIPVRAIRSAYGPMARGVLFHRPPAVPQILFDGISIVREFQPRGTVERQGWAMLKETMYDLNRDLGEGASSLALITHGILVKSLPLIHAGYDPNILADRLLDLGHEIEAEIQIVGQPFRYDTHALSIAKSAADADLNVAHHVIALSRHLGPDGQVLVKEGTGLEVRDAVYPGMCLPAGLVSSALGKTGDAGSDCYDHPYILLCDETIEDFGGFTQILEGFSTSRKSLVIFARNFTGTALGTLVVNVQKGGLRAAAIVVPEVGDRIFDLLGDIAVLTGGEVVSERLGTCLQSMRPGMLGRAKRVEVRANQCVMICEAPDRRRLEMRKRAIRDEILRVRYLSYDKEKLETRLARLTGGVAEIHVGAHSTAEQKQVVRRYHKSLYALRSAQRSAVVPGGGATYALLASGIERQPQSGEGRAAAAAMLAWALRMPERQLTQSVGRDSGLLHDAEGSYPQLSQRVFDVCERTYVDPYESGILDAAEVTREVIRRSISAAAIILRCEACVSKP